jgi:hypothetical protein
MTSEALKDVYETPRACVRGVFLEGAIADSKCPIIKNGEVWYNEYTTDNLETTVGQDVIIL